MKSDFYLDYEESFLTDAIIGGCRKGNLDSNWKDPAKKVFRNEILSAWQKSECRSDSYF